MSIPSIPGYTARPRSIGDYFAPPDGDWPRELWPNRVLAQLSPFPDGWLTVLESYDDEGERRGVSSVLVRSDDLDAVLDSVGWSGSSLGSAGFWTRGDERHFHDGLSDEELGRVRTMFFAQMRSHHGLRGPSLEVHHPFAWYFDAVPRGDRWTRLDEAGAEHDLLRTVTSTDGYRVQVDAVQLRRYLAATRLVLVTQHDIHLSSHMSPTDEARAEYRTDAAHLDWSCHSDSDWGGLPPGFSRLLGKVAVLPLDDDGFADIRRGGPFEEFIVGTDSASGVELRHTCDPAELGTYFDQPGEKRLHYLTPVYFRREVLVRYVAEPQRYHVTRSRLTCLDKWGMDLAINSEGLVEVYLGELGEKLPRQERPHWLAHNVAPVGRMDEGRFRRDFLNQPAPTHDPVWSLLRATRRVDDVFVARFGKPLRKPLEDPLRTEFERLYGPVTDDPSALLTPILTLTKGLVDSLDLPLLRTVTGETDKSVGSLRLVRRLVVQLGGDADELTAPLKSLQEIRSKGQAHRSDTGRAKLLAAEGLAGLTAPQQFETICDRISGSLEGLADLIDGKQIANSEG